MLMSWAKVFDKYNKIVNSDSIEKAKVYEFAELMSCLAESLGEFKKRPMEEVTNTPEFFYAISCVLGVFAKTISTTYLVDDNANFARKIINKFMKDFIREIEKSPEFLKQNVGAKKDVQSKSLENKNLA